MWKIPLEPKNVKNEYYLSCSEKSSSTLSSSQLSSQTFTSSSSSSAPVQSARKETSKHYRFNQVCYNIKKNSWIKTLQILVIENWLVMWKLRSGREHTKNCLLLNGMEISNKKELDKSRNDLPSAGNSSNSSSSSNKPKSGFFSFSLPSLMSIFFVV